MSDDLSTQERDDGWIDVQALMDRYTVEELAESAEQYFSRIENWDVALSKPWQGPIEAADLMIGFGAHLSALELSPGMQVLDFGAGSAWTSWMMTQLGCELIVTDVSPSALRIAAERFRRHPPNGSPPEPRFSVFDGWGLDVADASVHRISCTDAFHHVPNPGEVFAEFFRILRPGGVLVMSEPGPTHSSIPQSQFEMRHFRVVERDIVLSEISAQSAAAGFGTVEVGVFSGPPVFVPATDFDRAISSDSPLPGDATRQFLQHRRLLRLRKPGVAQLDSRSRAGLACELEVEITGDRLRITATNTGGVAWIQQLGADGLATVGHVSLGAHLFSADGELLDYEFLRVALSDGREALPPGGSVHVQGTVPPLAPGEYRLEFDLVAELVAWFSANGSRPVTLTIRR